MQNRVDWVLISFGTEVIKEKQPVQPVFPDYLSVSYDYFHVINAIRKIQHIKSSPEKVYQYLKKLDKNLEDAHFKSTLESFVKNGYFVV